MFNALRTTTATVSPAESYGERPTVTHNGKRYPLSTGAADDVYYFKHPRCTRLLYILSVNHSLDYIGLDVIDSEREECEDVMFLNSASDNHNGAKLMKLTPINQCKYLMRWI